MNDSRLNQAAAAIDDARTTLADLQEELAERPDSLIDARRYLNWALMALERAAGGVVINQPDSSDLDALHRAMVIMSAQGDQIGASRATAAITKIRSTPRVVLPEPKSRIEQDREASGL